MQAQTETALPLDKQKIFWTAVVLVLLVPVPVGFVFGWGVALMSWFAVGLWALFAVSIKSATASFWILVGLVALTPLSFGSVHLWSWGLMACVVGTLLAVWSCRVLLGWQTPDIRLKTTWPFVLLFGVTVMWGIAQSVSITPPDWHHPLWLSASEALDMNHSG